MRERDSNQLGGNGGHKKVISGGCSNLFSF